MCNDIGVNLYLWDIFLHILYKFVVELCLQNSYLLVGTKDFLLIFLQLRGDIPLCLSQRLLAEPVLGHLVLKGVAHLKVVTEYVVVAHLQRGDAGLLSLPLLYLQEILLTIVADGAQVVEFRGISRCYDVALADEEWRIGLYLLAYALTESVTEVQLLPHPSQRVVASMDAGFAYRTQSSQGIM